MTWTLRRVWASSEARQRGDQPQLFDMYDSNGEWHGSRRLADYALHYIKQREPNGFSHTTE